MSERTTLQGLGDCGDRVVVEVQTPGGWVQVGSVAKIDPPGSISSDDPRGRQVYVFGWYDGQGPAVWRSALGLDVGDIATREIITTSLEQTADLVASACELTWWRGSVPRALRFRAAGET